MSEEGIVGATLAINFEDGDIVLQTDGVDWDTHSYTSIIHKEKL